MKYLVSSILLLLVSCLFQNEAPAKFYVIPQPNSIQFENGNFEFDSEIQLATNNKDLNGIAELFKTQVEEVVSVQLVNSEKAKIKLVLNQKREKNELYYLDVSKKEIKIESGTKHGIFNGMQTLAQMLLFAEKDNGKIQLPKVKIEDSPRFKWRGLMIDESRYFFGPEKIKQVLDNMALCKLNVFHWHLTDDPGWRIEIKKYPKLTTIGGIGNDIDANAPARFYTQKEIIEIVKYASERFIEVIPEIDMPGHAAAANRAYPEFSGGGSKTHPDFTFNPGNEKTYEYLTNILKEIAGLFPSDYIHIGGDEVHFGNDNWNSDPFVQNLMEKKNLKDLKAVEGYFVKRMADTIKALNKTLVGWDEVVDLNLDNENTVVMWWRHNFPETLNNSLSKGYEVILCPRIPLYFDFDQHKTHKYGRKWQGAFSPTELVYSFPPDSLPGFIKNQNLVRGIQANLWTERVQSEERFDYLLYPRLFALAESAWTNSENKNLDNFNSRLVPMLAFLKNKNLIFFDPEKPEVTPEPIGYYKRKQN